MTSHYLKQWWLVYWRIYASLGLNELTTINSHQWLKVARKLLSKIWFKFPRGQYELSPQTPHIHTSQVRYGVSSMKLTRCNDIIMGAMVCQITSLIIVCSIVSSVGDQRKHQSSASLDQWQVNSRRKWPVMRKMFPFDDVIMCFMMGLVVMVTCSYIIYLLCWESICIDHRFSSLKGQCCKALIFSFMLAWKSCSTNSSVADYLKHHEAHVTSL